MVKRRASTTAAIAALALVAATLAAAAAQPLSPAAGARTGSHPTFTWTLPPNEAVDSLYIASRPDRTPEGEFYRENVVTTGFLGEGRPQTHWTPASALFAGSYWWNVETHDRETYARAYSQPMPFTVAPETRILRVRITRTSYYFSPDELEIDMRWATNVRDVVIEARILRRGRTVGRVRATNETTLSLDPDTESLTWQRPRRVRTGTRLTVVASVRGGGKTVAARRTVRAP